MEQQNTTPERPQDRSGDDTAIGSHVRQWLAQQFAAIDEKFAPQPPRSADE